MTACVTDGRAFWAKTEPERLAIVFDGHAIDTFPSVTTPAPKGVAMVQPALRSGGRIVYIASLAEVPGLPWP